MRTADGCPLMASEGRRKVLHVIAAYALGGAEKHLLDVLDGLSRTRFDVFVALPEGDLARILDERGIRNKRLPLRGIWDLLAIVRLFRCIRREKPDIVHTHDPRASVFGRIAARWAGVPMVFSTVHTSPVRRDSIGELLNRAYVWVDRQTARWSRYVIAVSEAVRGELIRGVGIDAEKVIALRPGIRLDAFCPAYGESGPHVSFKIGIVGRLEPEKGHEFVLRAMPGILRRSPVPVTLYVLGEGGFRPALMDLVEAHGLSSQVVFVGYVHDVRDHLASLDLVVSASTREGLGLVLIEAMAMGLPVVAPQIGGIPEVVEDGVTGVLFPPGNVEAFSEAVLDVLRDRERARQMGLAGRRIAEERFRLEDMILRLEELYTGRGMN